MIFEFDVLKYFSLYFLYFCSDAVLYYESFIHY